MSRIFLEIAVKSMWRMSIGLPFIDLITWLNVLKLPNIIFLSKLIFKNLN